MTKSMNNLITVFGLANGMIGGTILILPVLGLTTGYVLSPLLIIMMGITSLYTAYLIIVHLGKEKNIKESVLAHFHQDYRYMVAYGTIIWLN
jgi:amino acid permease